MGKAGDSFKNIAEKKRFAVGVIQEREKAEFGKGGKGDGRHINADRLRRGEKGTKIIIDCRWWPCRSEWRQWNGREH